MQPSKCLFQKVPTLHLVAESLFPSFSVHMLVQWCALGICMDNFKAFLVLETKQQPQNKQQPHLSKKQTNKNLKLQTKGTMRCFCNKSFTVNKLYNVTCSKYIHQRVIAQLIKPLYTYTSQSTGSLNIICCYNTTQNLVANR